MASSAFLSKSPPLLGTVVGWTVKPVALTLLCAAVSVVFFAVPLRFCDAPRLPAFRTRVRFRVAASSAGSAGEVGAIAAGSGAGLIGGLARSHRFCGDFKVGAVAGVVVCGGEVKAVGTGGEIAWDFDCSRR